MDCMQLQISEKNSEKFKNMQKQEEKYEKDIKGLKKRLDFLNSSNCKLINSELKRQFTETEIDQMESARLQSEYIITDQDGHDSSESENSRGPDIMQYTKEELDPSSLNVKTYTNQSRFLQD